MNPTRSKLSLNFQIHLVLFGLLFANFEIWLKSYVNKDSIDISWYCISNKIEIRSLNIAQLNFYPVGYYKCWYRVRLLTSYPVCSISSIIYTLLAWIPFCLWWPLCMCRSSPVAGFVANDCSVSNSRNQKYQPCFLVILMIMNITIGFCESVFSICISFIFSHYVLSNQWSDSLSLMFTR